MGLSILNISPNTGIIYCLFSYFHNREIALEKKKKKTTWPRFNPEQQQCTRPLLLLGLDIGVFWQIQSCVSDWFWLAQCLGRWRHCPRPAAARDIKGAAPVLAAVTGAEIITSVPAVICWLELIPRLGRNCISICLFTCNNTKLTSE